MRKIPKKQLKSMVGSPYYNKCCLTGLSDEKIDFHHNLIFANNQCDDEFSILPILTSIHKKANRKDIKEKLDWIMWNRATYDEIKKYSKAIDYVRYKRMLNLKYGTYNPNTFPFTREDFS